MYHFPYLENGPINEQALLKISRQHLEDGLPENPSPRQSKAFRILGLRHEALEAIVVAYRDGIRSRKSPLVVGRYYANLERAIGTYRNAQILAQRS